MPAAPRPPRPVPLSPAPSLRLRATASAMRATAALARRAGRGGSVLGGHVGLRVDRNLIANLARGRWIVAVSATNGKTTTTSLLRAALATAGPVVSNTSGSNLRTGVAAALADDLAIPRAALEVDEATLAVIATDLQPAVIVLGNLSRDQLDRYGEVRVVAQRWRAMLAELTDAHVVANADDPLVVWAAESASAVTWVAPGMAWTADALICPWCGGAIDHAAAGWRCTACPAARPTPQVTLDDDGLVIHDDPVLHVDLALSLPGDFNRANAALAATAASLGGIDWQVATAAMSATTEVAGRYRTVAHGSHQLRLLMAKNPAGWRESLQIVAPPPTPVIVGINARVADGHDPSWLYDVDFAPLAGRPVVATGERAEDLSVRLHYAGIDHEVHPGDALGALVGLEPGPVDLVCNYTAFADVLAGLR